MVIEYYIRYTKIIYHGAKKKMCHREYNDISLTHKNWDELEPFGKPIYTSKDAIEGPTSRQVGKFVTKSIEYIEKHLGYQLAITKPQEQK